ncbi:cupin domain-containing protein [Sabulicella glaciei]|uniref:Cupin domain-containing protein n=1 Tax=Sabulicella glaciei TaxID=2984948 RepID=A0ABT3P235_9PROT|nr:hypothetical protein [Roseococcus sp. MDT2-1-1]MCW8088467.1 cupin domain-containing protein [Roseococcus sp. MDT2-1-1]
MSSAAFQDVCAISSRAGGPPMALRRRAAIAALGAAVMTGAPLPPVAAQQPPALVVRPLAEKRLAELPPGPLVWRIENFPSLAEARAAAGPTALAAEAAGRVWLFTLGRTGGATPGGTPVTEVGPIPELRAPEYLLRINQASGPPGSVTPVHTHPGSEAFYVLAGETSQQTSHGISRVGAGQALAGHGADVPMQVSSSGSTDLLSLMMFVVDATRPFSSTASIQ